MNLNERIMRRYLAANVLPFKPAGPTLAIQGRKYVLSDYFPALDVMEEATSGARLIDVGGKRFSYLWAFDMEKKIVAMWRVSDGDEKAYGSSSQMASAIVALDRKKQLNRVTHDEYRELERYMQKRNDDAIADMRKYIESMATDWDRKAKAIATELFEKQVEPKIFAKFREIDQGVIPFGFKPNEWNTRPVAEQAKVFVTGQVTGKEFTLKNVDDFARTKGIDPDDPPGDVQALDWARQEILDAFIERHFK